MDTNPGRRAAKVALLALLALGVLALPFAGPWLGLASYQSLAPAPGFRVDIPAGPLNVYQIGQGRNAVLVHGQPGSASMMTPLAQALANAGLRVTWYDRMGWGHSGQRRESQPANPTSHGADLNDLIATLALVDPVVVGYSYGGGAAMEALRLKPDVSRVLVLVSSVGAPVKRGSGSLLERVFLHPLFMRWSLGTTFTAQAATAPVMEAFSAPESLGVRERDTFVAALALPGVPGHWARERRERYEGFAGYLPREVHACTLIVHGDDDRIVGVDVARFLAQEIPNAETSIVPQAGHALVLTQPGRIASRVVEHTRHCDAGDQVG